MIIREQFYEILHPEPDRSQQWRDMKHRIEIAGRTCYKSDSNGKPEEFIRKLIKSGHESVLEHEVIQVRFVTDRGVTHELVRHRLAAYSQESTRYCNYAGDHIRFIKPVDFELDEEDEALLHAIEKHYNKCIVKGLSPQQARYFLPNGLKTEIVMTANLREWRHIFKLRTSGKAHPQIRALLTALCDELKTYLPEVFGEL